MKRNLKAALSWNVGGHMVQAIGLIVQAAIAARFLTPDQVGYYAIAMTIQTLVRSVPNSGLLYTLASLPKVRKIHFQMTSGVMPFVGCVQALVLIVGSFILERIFGPSPLTQFVIFLSGLCVIEGLLVPFEGSRLRLIEHKRLTLADSGGVSVGIVTLTASLVLSLGPGSLVVSSYANSIVKASILYAAAWPAFRPIFPQMRFMKRILAHAFKLTLSSFLLLAGSQGDRLLMGLVMGPGLAASYWRSNQIANLPLSFYSRLFYRVFLSASADENRSGLKKEAVARLALNSSLRFGLCFGLVVSVTAPQITSVVLGSGWGSTAVALSALAPFIGFKFLIRSFDSLMVGVNKPVISIVGQAALVLGIVAAIVLGSTLGFYFSCLFIAFAQAASGMFYAASALRSKLINKRDCLDVSIALLKDALALGLPTILLAFMLSLFSASDLLHLAVMGVLVFGWVFAILRDLHLQNFIPPARVSQ